MVIYEFINRKDLLNILCIVVSDYNCMDEEIYF